MKYFNPRDCIYCEQPCNEGSNVCFTCWEEKTKDCKTQTLEEYLNNDEKY